MLRNIGNDFGKEFTFNHGNLKIAIDPITKGKKKRAMPARKHHHQLILASVSGIGAMS